MANVIQQQDEQAAEFNVAVWPPLYPVREVDPNGLDAHAPGAKLDAGKPLAGLLSDFSFGLQQVVAVGTYGAAKYSRGGWQSVDNGIERYTDALWRHLLACRHEPCDRDTHLSHMAHVAWNALAVLELSAREAGEKAAA